jgi:capsular polysaccharide biosynthesis protein
MLEIQYYWSVIRKKLWLILLITVVCCAFAGFLSYRMVPQYEASAKLIVNRHSAQDRAGATPDAGSITSDMMLIKTYKEIIRTPRILEKVVERHPELQATVRELRAKIRVSSVNESLVMSISAVDPQPERAAQMANAVSDVFRREIKTLMKIDNVFVLNWADPSDVSSESPRPIRNVVIAFVVAALAGSVIAFLLDRLNGTLRTEKDILARLELPVLAEIPRMKRKDRREAGVSAGVTTSAGGNRHVTFDA